MSEYFSYMELINVAKSLFLVGIRLMILQVQSLLGAVKYRSV